MKPDLAMAVRIRMSPFGAARCARLVNKVGKIVGGTST
jgi:hypothetical protein